ncbi:DUF2642 domain-containing protein [Paenibacillus soyae]|uniref:DUF2642 domain-containing protein n=1 Tax=Paenibacillus soyae TaxID=2969249 RepID=A0A9X2S8W2_9BACL|nr:DUF2642 domain-containing protein [Paenibacillus soyae]MCR2804560.1 DUF2642 domain-containing protein [Paenibacillus soyae]
MQILKSWLGTHVELMLSGCIELQGEIIDVGNDILVLYDNNRYAYIPIHHLQFLKAAQKDNEEQMKPPAPSFEHENISYRKILMNARGLFSEISVGDKTLHGYVTSIMNDYLTFYSPLQRTVYVSVNHIKYIVPYHSNVTPFSLGLENFPIQPASMPLSRTLDQQLRKLEKQIVILNLDGKPHRAGLLKRVEHNLIELVQAEGSTIVVHTDHIKTIHSIQA